MNETDDKAQDETDDRGLHAVNADARAGAGRAQIVGHGRARQHAEGEDARVAVSFAGHEQLASGAASGQREGEAGGDHAEIVPQKVAVGHGLPLEAELQAAGEGVGDERGREHGRQSEEEMGVAEEEQVTERAHGAEAAALGDDPDHEGQTQRGDKGCVLGTGAFHRIEQGTALRLTRNLREDEIEQQQTHDHGGEDRAGNHALGIAAAEGIAPPEEEGADPDAGDRCRTGPRL